MLVCCVFVKEERAREADCGSSLGFVQVAVVVVVVVVVPVDVEEVPLDTGLKLLKTPFTSRKEPRRVEQEPGKAA